MHFLLQKVEQGLEELWYTVHATWCPNFVGVTLFSFKNCQHAIDATMLHQQLSHMKCIKSDP